MAVSRAGADAGTRQGRTVHIGRQPVHDLDDSLYGYELLFRPSADAVSSGVDGSGPGGPGGPGEDVDGDTATTATILSAFSEFGLPDLLGDRYGFINLTRAFIVGQIPVPFDPDRAVLEILETVEVDEDVVLGARRLVAEGYRLALDDFVWSRQAWPLLELADVVKIDVLAQPWEAVLELAERCRPFGVDLLAERIETEEMLARCKDAGFRYFQGYYLGRPQVLSAESLTPGQAIALELVSRLGDPEVSPARVEDLLRTDPALTYRLLRIANSAANGLIRPVSTIRDAVVIVGLAKLRAWLILLSLSGAGSRQEGLIGALALARTCELVAAAQGQARPGQTGSGGVKPDVAFTLGLLQGIADSLGRDVAQLADGLPPLDDELDAALRGGPGPMRSVLDAVLAYQRREGAGVRACGQDETAIGHAYLAGLAWAYRTSRSAQSD